MSDKLTCVDCATPLETKQPFCDTCWVRLPKSMRATYNAARDALNENRSNNQERIERKTKAFIKALWDLKAYVTARGVAP